MEEGTDNGNEMTEQYLPGDEGGASLHNTSLGFPNPRTEEEEESIKSSGRSGPDGSPSFEESAPFLPSNNNDNDDDDESVVFRPVRQLDFSALDETGQTEELIEIHGRATSPELLQRQVCGAHLTPNEPREGSPEGRFYELESSPLCESDNEELDSQVIFSPLRHIHASVSSENASLGASPQSMAQDRQNKSQGDCGVGMRCSQSNVHSHHSPVLELSCSGLQREKVMTPLYSPAIKSLRDEFIGPVGLEDKNVQSVSVRNVFVNSSPDRKDVSPKSSSLTHSGQLDRSPVYSEPVSGSNVSPRQPDNDMNQNQPVSFTWDIPDVNSHPKPKPINAKKQPFIISSSNNSYRKNTVPVKNSDRGIPVPVPKSKNDISIKRAHEQGDGKVSPKVSPPAGQLGQSQRVQGRSVQGMGKHPSLKSLNKQADVSSVSGQPHQQLPVENRQHTDGRQQRGDRQMQDRQMQDRQMQDRRQVEGEYDRRDKDDRQQMQLNTSNESYSSVTTDHPLHNVVTQMQQLGSQWDDRQTPGKEMHVQGMEDVRSQLQSMLRMSRQMVETDNQYDQSEVHENVSGLLMGFSHEMYNTSQVFSDFSTSNMWTDHSQVTRNDSSLQAENHSLREALEKERYRRKHCESQIQHQNVKLLEIQQQLAVAVSTDKRKDLMIEQLDKQLAKVVEGWRKRDEDKEKHMSHLRLDCQKLEEKLLDQQKHMEKWRKNIEDTQREKESLKVTLEKVKNELKENERSCRHLRDLLEGEKEKEKLLSEEWGKLREAREQSERKVQGLQDKLHREQDDWFTREQELIKKMEETSEKSHEMVLKEKEKNEELEAKVKDLEEIAHLSQSEIKRLEMELDAAIREKESLKVEMGIREAKHESSLRTLEADMHSKMQKEIAAQVAEAHKKFEEEESTIRENHRRQMKELGQRHTKEVEKQLAGYHDDLKRIEDNNRKTCQEYEDKIFQLRSEITSLHQSKQKLESQRSEVLVKLQYMMQSQWNEAVSMLCSTPQRKAQMYTNTSFSLSNKAPSVLEDSSINGPSPGTLLDPQAPPTVTPGYGAQQNPIYVLANHTTEDNQADMTTAYHVQQMMQSLALGPHSVNQQTAPTSTSSPLSSRTRPPPHRETFPPQIPPIPSSSEGFDPTLEDLRELTARSTSGGSDSEHVACSVPAPNSATSDKGRQLLPQNTGIENVSDTDQPGQPPHHMSSHMTSPPRIPPTHYDDTVHRWLQGNLGAQVNGGSRGPDCVSAVPMRPPQQHDSSYGDWRNGLQGSVSPKVSQRSVMHSPPTKQMPSNQNAQEQTREDKGSIFNDSARLEEEYQSLACQLQEHEVRQDQLQYYIQMLLQKPPSSEMDETESQQNISTGSTAHTEELAMNETAQAAQLHQELQRLQQLRTQQVQGQSKGAATNGDLGVMNPEQISEISKLLNQHMHLIAGAQGGRQRAVGGGAGSEAGVKQQHQHQQHKSQSKSIKDGRHVTKHNSSHSSEDANRSKNKSIVIPAGQPDAGHKVTTPSHHAASKKGDKTAATSVGQGKQVKGKSAWK